MLETPDDPLLGPRSEFFSGLSGGAGGARSGAAALIERLGCRVLLLFVRHACLLRPLSHAGKLQLVRVRLPFPPPAPP